VSDDGSSDHGSEPNSGCSCITAARSDATPSFAWAGGALLAGAGIGRRRRARAERAGCSGVESSRVSCRFRGPSNVAGLAKENGDARVHGPHPGERG
jgi:LPXTG-motif cell wall-anchored protein